MNLLNMLRGLWLKCVSFVVVISTEQQNPKTVSLHTTLTQTTVSATIQDFGGNKGKLFTNQCCVSKEGLLGKFSFKLKFSVKMEKTNLSNPLHFRQLSNYLEPSVVQDTLQHKGIKKHLWSPIRSYCQRCNSTFENLGATK